ncbi:glycoside hydrolase family 18 protein [Yeosuana sp. MJ-SS3]|uniref:chitinase n=1 Tax=Gilvirhabdus luticola TaxID=3079858 RepID=A0ABU3U6K7_9FLAO|nr:glycoside hydrolase family 18 protein [Yeosuana sp. MJ-SS3]MDU8886036.1 glycoside hydrolase family 18 protein [Yeosuana sp. MJ-SS3]
MKSLKCFVFFYLILLISCNKKEKTLDKKEHSISVMAYYVPKQDYPINQLPLNKLTHIIFSFSKVIDGEMKFNNQENDSLLHEVVKQREKHPDLKVMIACGGWGADGFSDMASTADNRQKFVKSSIDFVKKYDLDGINIDWEYPTIPAANTGARVEDKQNFTLLMKELRQELNTLERTQTLTFASAGWERYYDNIELNEVMQNVDYMNIMTYDQVGGSSPFTGHHTPLGLIMEEDIIDTPLYVYLQEKKVQMENSGRKFEPRSAERIIDYCIDKGVKPEKIVIGAAFYGRAWKGVPPENNGLYQPNKGAYIGWSSYSQIRKEFETNKNYQRNWDSIAKAPYLFSANDSIFISYDDTLSVKLKTKYAINKNLGGIMFWQLTNDTKEEKSLLQSIYDAAKE